MRKYSIAWVMAFLIITGFISCKESVTPTPYTYTSVFTGEHSKTWKVKFFEQTLDGAVVETFSISCTTDDLFTFTANPEHTYKVTSGSKKCNTDPVEDDVIIDTWDFVNASATMQMIFPIFDPTGRLPFIVREAKKNSMVLELFFDETGTESYRIHYEATDED
jgi:hypothetical protein